MRAQELQLQQLEMNVLLQIKKNSSHLALDH